MPLKTTLGSALLLLAALPLAAADFPQAPTLPLGGTSLVGPGQVAKGSFYGPKANRASPAASPGGPGWAITVGQASPNAWDSGLQIPLAQGIAKGDSCLLLFRARATGDSMAAVGNAVVNAHVDKSYPTAMSRDFRAGREWKLIILPFSAENTLPAGAAQLSLQVGQALQNLEVAGFTLLNFGPDVPLSSLPQPGFTYEGRDPDAPWRKEALARIDQLRQGDFGLAIHDSGGKPLPGASVQVRLRRHSFGFGSAVNAFWLRDPSPNGARYREIVNDNFSRVVLENDLKPFARRAGKDNKNGYYRHEWTGEALEWLARNHLETRGHYLFWGPFDSDTEKLRDDPPALRAWISAHMAEAAAFAGSRVCEWDALNHNSSWDPKNLVKNVLGPALHSDIMRECRSLTKLPLWVNEDQVFRPGRQQDDYFRDIQGLLKAGFPPDGIGNQAHFHASFLPSPADMLAVSDRFATLVPRLQITEFDVVTNGDLQLQADWTRDCLVMAYSHPAYTGFLTWGFWEGSIYNPEIGLWNKDWTVRPNGQAWLDWVGGRWRTRTSGSSGDDGTYAFRGHEGRYQVTVEHGGKRFDTEAVLTRAAPRAEITLP